MVLGDGRVQAAVRRALLGRTELVALVRPQHVVANLRAEIREIIVWLTATHPLKVDAALLPLSKLDT
eukprot:1546629-Pyramimonas_sp.AAC.1